ncbi:PBSX family phage terminase large subunit [Lacticaseibacillus pabuli]|uniref:PBSX family phage terminase large subunit n=1 Tax=Lacticaseibacillus pabuli TaxID=3025672 RepID=A0ABY7WTY2_9LACO|nr:PBSX family phage terminase large subunit [Lacticaseibacillus sp. KACC 23028]WDF83622.1 PBSX family phage terminase large subunit [Lacticaseibacillus sp. KACC 23028]
MAMISFTPFSSKQLTTLNWWRSEPQMQAIICDGAVRSGKTFSMSLGYVFWSMIMFDGQQFGIAGKTIGSLRRNVIRPLTGALSTIGMSVIDHRSDNMIEVAFDGVTNYFYLFGGKDESSQDLVQGITLAGFFFDEVALMPESFVNQATARVSVEGGRFWFNCNPAGPYHWFKQQWIDEADQKKALRVHFTMRDNPSLTADVIDRYEHLYSGVFYKRYIQGLWVMADGIIYSNFDETTMVKELPDGAVPDESWVSCDYGTMNATTFALWQHWDNAWYCTDEFYHSGREAGHQRTDAQYADNMEEFYQHNGLDKKSVRIILDPSAKSFRTELRQRGFSTRHARNNVLDGIREMMTLMSNGVMYWSKKCVNTFKEFNSYMWDEKAADRGEDKPIKQNDHAMDRDRYMAEMVIVPRMRHDGFYD